MARELTRFPIGVMVRAVLLVEAESAEEAGEKANGSIHDAITREFQAGQHKARKGVELKMIGRFDVEHLPADVVGWLIQEPCG